MTSRDRDPLPHEQHTARNAMRRKDLKQSVTTESLHSMPDDDLTEDHMRLSAEVVRAAPARLDYRH